MLASIKTLLSSIVDYAGLFPPAKLGMREAMANYNRDRSSSYNWMLGRFVLPMSRLDEFETLLPTFDLKQWSLSLILSKDWQVELEKVRSLNEQDKITITALEFPPLSPTEIKNIIPHLPAKVEAFFEIPFNSDLEEYLAVLQYPGVAAKIRTGGITDDAFPSIPQLCHFIPAFAQNKIPFKATAGLHHPLPGNYRLTYQSDSPSTVMHGFLNVAVLAALVYWQKIAPSEALEVLKESRRDGFQFETDGIVWHNYRLDIAEIEQARQRFFRSFGSCSFEEPVDDLLKIQNSKFKMTNTPTPITDRTFEFAVRIVNLCKVLDENPGVGRTLSKQLIRSGTSIGANVEESQSAQSTADFVHKLEIALKEARETRYWLRLLITTEVIAENRLSSLLEETNELIKVIAAHRQDQT